MAIFVLGDADRLDRLAADDDTSQVTSLGGECSRPGRKICTPAGAAPPPEVRAHLDAIN